MKNNDATRSFVTKILWVIPLSLIIVLYLYQKPTLSDSDITLTSFIWSCLWFVFALYLGIVPNTTKRLPSNLRIVMCGVGISFGIFVSGLAIVSVDNNISQPYIHIADFLYGFAILYWCIYALVTTTSRLSKTKKICKLVIYWTMTGAFISLSSLSKDIRQFAGFLLFILPCIAYYTGCIDGGHDLIKNMRNKTKRIRQADNIMINNINAELDATNQIDNKEADSTKKSNNSLIRQIYISGIVISIDIILCILLPWWLPGTPAIVWWFIVYLTVYNAMSIYYLTIIWSKKRLTIDNILLMNIYNRLNLLDKTSARKTRLSLIKLHLPWLIGICTIPAIIQILDIYNVFPSSYCKYPPFWKSPCNICPILFSIPYCLYGYGIIKTKLKLWVNHAS